MRWDFLVREAILGLSCVLEQVALQAQPWGPSLFQTEEVPVVAGHVGTNMIRDQRLAPPVYRFGTDANPPCRKAFPRSLADADPQP